MAKLDVKPLEKFRPQGKNTNKHTQRGMGAIERSMRRFGYVAPMTAAADGEIIDGSARLETSAHVFDADDVIVVEHDGTKPVVMVRTDIANAETPEARAISIAANRIAQLNLDYDTDLLADAIEQGFDASELWHEDELDDLLHEMTAPPSLDDLQAEYGEPDVTDFWPFVRVQVSPETKATFDDLWEQAPGDTDDEKMANLLGAVDATLFGGG